MALARQADAGLTAGRLAPRPGWAKRALAPLAVSLAFVADVRGWFTWHCPVAWAFHVPCPTCGVTRATRHLLHLDLAGATRVHPLALVVVPFVAALVAGELAAFAWTGRLGSVTRRPWVRRAGFALCVALFVVWVARFLGAFGGPVGV